MKANLQALDMEGTHNHNILYEYCIEIFKSVVAFYLIDSVKSFKYGHTFNCNSWEARLLLLTHCTSGI
jgi:hypothetical protein